MNTVVYSAVKITDNDNLISNPFHKQKQSLPQDALEQCKQKIKFIQDNIFPLLEREMKERDFKETYHKHFTTATTLTNATGIYTTILPPLFHYDVNSKFIALASIALIGVLAECVLRKIGRSPIEKIAIRCLMPKSEGLKQNSKFIEQQIDWTSNDTSDVFKDTTLLDIKKLIRRSESFFDSFSTSFIKSSERQIDSAFSEKENIKGMIFQMQSDYFGSSRIFTHLFQVKVKKELYKEFIRVDEKTRNHVIDNILDYIEEEIPANFDLGLLNEDNEDEDFLKLIDDKSPRQRETRDAILQSISDKTKDEHIQMDSIIEDVLFGYLDQETDGITIHMPIEMSELEIKDEKKVNVEDEREDDRKINVKDERKIDVEDENKEDKENIEV